ncbi:MAG: helix-turn-helix transcriptional regulator [Bacteroidia bacterium]|nr:helix-turn-helix transcriptional regulator [Bacteroidia bacterium]
MRERIKQIMENENLTPARFADKLQINRANISHILNGRNNPSLDIVSKILSEMPHINTEWLINGFGQMYKDEFDINSIPKEHDLFNQNPIISPQERDVVAKTERIEVNKPENDTQVTENKVINIQKSYNKKISQIIIYYNDSTFETFIPHSAQ